MKHREFYRKYKTNYPPIVNPLITKENAWYIIFITAVAIFIVPLIMYGRQRSVTFSFESYLRLMEYFSLVVVPFVGFLFWVNWRETLRQKRGYCWVGKFEVTGKQLSFMRCYLLLTPEPDHKIRVDRDLYDTTIVGDVVQLRRDALGKIEKIRNVNNFSTRLTRAAAKHVLKKASSRVSAGDEGGQAQFR